MKGVALSILALNSTIDMAASRHFGIVEQHPAVSGIFMAVGVALWVSALICIWHGK